jgi:hypothetical protein
MRRRTLLRTVVAGAAAGLVPADPTTVEELPNNTDDVIATSQDRRVRYTEVDDVHDGTLANWIIENRHTGDTVYSLTFPKAVVAHSYASNDRVVVITDGEAYARQTTEWFLQYDSGRQRVVQDDGTTRIADFNDNGLIQRRR